MLYRFVITPKKDNYIIKFVKITFSALFMNWYYILKMYGINLLHYWFKLVWIDYRIVQELLIDVINCKWILLRLIFSKSYNFLIWRRVSNLSLRTRSLNLAMWVESYIRIFKQIKNNDVKMFYMDRMIAIMRWSIYSTNQGISD